MRDVVEVSMVSQRPLLVVWRKHVVGLDVHHGHLMEVSMVSRRLLLVVWRKHVVVVDGRL